VPLYFIFQSRSRSKFNFVLDSNEFEIYKNNFKMEKLSYSLLWPWAKTQQHPRIGPAGQPPLFLLRGPAGPIGLLLDSPTSPGVPDKVNPVGLT
jgi:hypothetical protein